MEIAAPNPTLTSGKRIRGAINMVMSVRRWRSASVSSLRYTIPMLRADMSVGLRGDVVRSHDFDENLLEVLLVILVAKLRESAFGEQLAGLDNADGVTKFFDFGHDVCGEDDGFAVVATFA